MLRPSLSHHCARSHWQVSNSPPPQIAAAKAMASWHVSAAVFHGSSCPVVSFGCAQPGHCQAEQLA